MNKTISTLLKKIAKRKFVNPSISTTDKMYLVMGDAHRINGNALKADENYASAVCQRVCDGLDVSNDDSGAVCDWVMNGDYGNRPTINSVVREFKSEM